MIRISRGRLKSYILTILIITSIIQVGILWNNENQGVPNIISGFITNFFPLSNSDPSDEYFNPYQIVVSSGEETYWQIAQKDIDYYEGLWNEGKTYLKEILSSDKIQIIEVPEGMKWENVVSRKAFIFEFGTSLQGDLLGWFLNEPNFSVQPGIYKVAILPSDDNVNNLNTVYILYEEKIYKYALPFKSYNQQRYDEIIENLEKETNRRQYKVIKDYFRSGSKVPAVRQDAFIAAIGADSDNLYNLICTAPQGFEISNTDKNSEAESLAYKILINNENSYIPTFPNKNEVTEFKSQYDVYSVYKDGLLEYRNLIKAENVTGSGIGEAFKKAMEFINERKKLVEGEGLVDIYMSGAQESKDTKGAYEFKFDYKVKNIPVFFKYKATEANKKELNNAITITATGSEIINCQWIMKSFTLGDINPYKVKFDSFFDELNKVKPELVAALKNNSTEFINDLNISYGFNSEYIDVQNLKPVWSTRTNTSEQYLFIPMQEDQGDN